MWRCYYVLLYCSFISWENMLRKYFSVYLLKIDGGLNVVIWWWVSFVCWWCWWWWWCFFWMMVYRNWGFFSVVGLRFDMYKFVWCCVDIDYRYKGNICCLKWFVVCLVLGKFFVVVSLCFWLSFVFI